MRCMVFGMSICFISHIIRIGTLKFLFKETFDCLLWLGLFLGWPFLSMNALHIIITLLFEAALNKTICTPPPPHLSCDWLTITYPLDFFISLSENLFN